MSRITKPFQFQCCACGVKRDQRGNSLTHARAAMHGRGWASTSMTSKSAQDICDVCLKKHPTYEPGRPFKRSVWADMFSLEKGKL